MKRCADVIKGLLLLFVVSGIVLFQIPGRRYLPGLISHRSAGTTTNAFSGRELLQFQEALPKHDRAAAARSSVGILPAGLPAVPVIGVSSLTPAAPRAASPVALSPRPLGRAPPL